MSSTTSPEAKKINMMNSMLPNSSGNPKNIKKDPLRCLELYKYLYRSLHEIQNTSETTIKQYKEVHHKMFLTRTCTPDEIDDSSFKPIRESYLNMLVNELPSVILENKQTNMFEECLCMSYNLHKWAPYMKKKIDKTLLINMDRIQYIKFKINVHIA